jgi:hypothetical protein
MIFQFWNNKKLILVTFRVQVWSTGNFQMKERPVAKKFSDLRAQMTPDARLSAQAAAH